MLIKEKKFLKIKNKHKRKGYIMKKLIALFLTVAMCISLVACEKRGAGAENDSSLNVDETTKIKPIQVDFGQEFTIKMGEVAKIGIDDIYFEMVDSEFLQFDGYTNTQVFYEFTAPDKTTYTGGCSFFSNSDKIEWVDQYNPYKVTLTAGTMDSITAIIENAVYPDEPLQLSGNPSDRYTTTKLEYIERERFIVYLDKGVTVEGDLIQNIEKLMADIEETTKLSFNAYLTGEKYKDDILPRYYTDYRKFEGVDPDRNKISIFVVNKEITTAFGYEGTVVITPNDILFYNGNEQTALMHELLHCLHLSNGKNPGHTMSEGYATYFTTYINEKDKNDLYNQNWRQNYSYYEKDITANNAEQLFLTESSWNSYLYGFRFMTYLAETYGVDKINEIIKAFPPKALNPSPTSEEVAKVIKEKTSNNVFVDFGNWYQKNKGKFNVY